MTAKQLVEILKKEMGPIIEETVRPMFKQSLKPIIATQEIHTRKIDALTADMSKVQKLAETTVDIVKARYEKNKREINEVKDHLGLRKEPQFAE